MQLLRAGGVRLVPLACGCARQRVPLTAAPIARTSSARVVA
jgi:hypothetical protein